MAVGNKEITDLTLVPAPENTDIYCVKLGTDYRIRTGVAGGLATLGGDRKIASDQMPTMVVPPQDWATLTGVPATFTPSAHTHDAADIVSGTLPVTRGGTGTTSGTGTGPVVRANAPTLTGDAIGGTLTLGGGKKLAKITVSNAAPGTLVDGELYLKY
jgi:hypothetical protein